MTFLNFIVSILALFVSTSFFCLLMTTDLGWGPVVYVTCFIGGILLTAWAAVACLDLFKKISWPD
jgi:hypothetical protein